MRLHYRTSIAFVLALAFGVVGLSAAGRAAPTVNGGIGVAGCAKLGPDIKPDEGLNHLPNALLYYWVQGYVSAANIHLLNENNNHLDVGTIDDKSVLKLVADFCKANPDDKPIRAIDKLIREAKKVKVKEEDVFNPWED